MLSLFQRILGGNDQDWLGTAADVLMPAEPPRVLLDASCTLHCFGGHSRNCSEHGAWTLCTDGLGAAPLVYSLGVGSHINFDVAVLRYARGARVRAFDPTVSREKFQALASARLTAEERLRFTFLPIGLSGKEDFLNFYSLYAKGGGSLALGEGKAVPKGYHPHVEKQGLVARLPTLQLFAGDANETIDVLKIDVRTSDSKTNPRPCIHAFR